MLVVERSETDNMNINDKVQALKEYIDKSPHHYSEIKHKIMEAASAYADDYTDEARLADIIMLELLEKSDG